MKIKFGIYKSNGEFSLLDEPFKMKQHPNQQNGIDMYVTVLNHLTWNTNTVKLYENKKGLHFKKDGTHYLKDFTQKIMYVPQQIYPV